MSKLGCHHWSIWACKKYISSPLKYFKTGKFNPKIALIKLTCFKVGTENQNNYMCL